MLVKDTLKDGYIKAAKNLARQPRQDLPVRKPAKKNRKQKQSL